MKLLTLDTVETAQAKLADCIADCTADWLPPLETVAVNAAAGRTLAADVVAPENIPGFRRATVDGYAVVSADTAGCGESLPVFLKYAGTVEMGAAAGFAISRGECAYVPTGGMMPAGADAMVMVEYAENAGDTVALYEPAAVGKGIAEADEDMRRGETVLKKGTLLRPQEIGALAALGIGEIQAYAPLRLALFSTGNELAPPGKQPAPGEIRDINTCALGALAARRGFAIVLQQTLGDDAALLEAAVRDALAAVDVVAVSGGSSQGEKDLTAEVFSRVAQPGVFTHGLAVKPGKPTILAYDRPTKTILAGLPGHPVSAIMVFETLLSPFARRLRGEPEPLPLPARIANDLAASPGKDCYQPVLLRRNGDAYIAEPVFGKSGMISTLTRADGYIVIDSSKEGLRQGEPVWVHLWH